MYIVGTDKKHLSEVLLISPHNMFCDKKKIYGIPFLSTAIKIILQVLWRNEKNVPVHCISYNFTCVLSKDSDKPVHLCSLIRFFAGCMKMLCVLSYPVTGRQISDAWMFSMITCLRRNQENIIPFG